jgi:glycosyltransferase involved in cell wall biosynthesis
MPITYISWAPHCSRSDHTARELGGRSHMVYWHRLGSHPATVLFKYVGQSLSTWRVLFRERPSAVFVMSPPPTAVLAVYLYCLLTRTPFVIDAHSGVFQNPRWRHFQRLHFWLCRQAASTIVSNASLADLVAAHGGSATLVPDVPIRFDGERALRREGEFFIVCVTSFDRDEPLGAMVEAAQRLPEVPFFMTGSATRGRQVLPSNLPANLTLTGFLDAERYGALLQTAGAVMALTTQENTMQRGAYEAIYQGTPVIVSDSKLLREAFDEGAVHVDNSPDAIVDAILAIRREHLTFRKQAQSLRLRKEQRWIETKASLIRLIQVSSRRA